MSDKTDIEWADATWSPLIGCDRVSPGCDHCYAIGTARIRASNPNLKVAAAFAGTTERRDGRVDWTGKVNLLPDRLSQPLRWRKPRRIFVNSMSDLFHQDVPDEYIARVFAVMALAPKHTFQVLTKRHARMRSLLNSGEFWRSVGPHMSEIVGARTQIDDARLLPNVWLGISAENQDWYNRRWPALRETPAAVRFVSAEPLLGELSLFANSTVDGHPMPDWVIVGGESGPGARPMHPAWARGLRDECDEHGIAYLFKQWGEWAPVSGSLPYRTRWGYLRPDATWGAPQTGGTDIARVGKKRAGRLLDGRTWDEYPVAG